MLFLLPAGDASAARPPDPAAKRFDRRMVPMILSYGLFGFGYVITATFISALVRTTPAIASIEPVVWLVVGLTGIPSVALWSWIGRRLGNPASIAIACLLEAIGVAATVLVPDPVAVLVGAALLGGTFMGITALGLTTAREIGIVAGMVDPRRTIALLVVSFGTGQMIGPLFAGYAADASGGFTMPSLVAAGALVIAAGLAMTVRTGATVDRS